MEGPRLPPRGYTVVSLDLDPKIVQQALKEATERSYVPVFEKVHGEQDPKRLQSRVKRLDTAALRAINVALRELVRLVDPRWTPSTFSFMKSLPGGAIQEAHYDYTTEDRDRALAVGGNGCITGSAIVALEEGTTLRVFKGCFRDKDPACEAYVSIPPGYALIFCGDLVHSGAAYTTTNHRLHCYLAVGDKKWVPDVVQDVLPKVFYCKWEGCDHFDDDSNRIRNHRFYCKYNPRGDENRVNKRLKRIN